MRRIKLLLGLVFALLATTSTMAQGTLYASYDSASIWEGKGSDNLTGFSIGYAMNNELDSYLPFFLNYGLKFTYVSDNGDDSSTKFTSIEIPLNIRYQIDLLDAVALAPYAGFNYRCGIAASSADGDDKTNLYSSSDMGDEEFKRFRGGFQCGLDLQIDFLSVGIGYQRDFFHISSGCRYSSFAIRGGVRF